MERAACTAALAGRLSAFEDGVARKLSEMSRILTTSLAAASGLSTATTNAPEDGAAAAEQTDSRHNESRQNAEGRRESQGNENNQRVQRIEDRQDRRGAAPQYLVQAGRETGVGTGTGVGRRGDFTGEGSEGAKDAVMASEGQRGYVAVAGEAAVAVGQRDGTAHDRGNMAGKGSRGGGGESAGGRRGGRGGETGCRGGGGGGGEGGGGGGVGGGGEGGGEAGEGGWGGGERDGGKIGKGQEGWGGRAGAGRRSRNRDSERSLSWSVDAEDQGVSLGPDNEGMPSWAKPTRTNADKMTTGERDVRPGSAVSPAWIYGPGLSRPRSTSRQRDCNSGWGNVTSDAETRTGTRNGVRSGTKSGARSGAKSGLGNGMGNPTWNTARNGAGNGARTGGRNEGSSLETPRKGERRRRREMSSIEGASNQSEAPPSFDCRSDGSWVGHTKRGGSDCGGGCGGYGRGGGGGRGVCGRGGRGRRRGKRDVQAESALDAVERQIPAALQRGGLRLYPSEGVDGGERGTGRGQRRVGGRAGGGGWEGRSYLREEDENNHETDAACPCRSETSVLRMTKKGIGSNSSSTVTGTGSCSRSRSRSGSRRRGNSRSNSSSSNNRRSRSGSRRRDNSRGNSSSSNNRRSRRSGMRSSSRRRKSYRRQCRQRSPGASIPRSATTSLAAGRRAPAPREIHRDIGSGGSGSSSRGGVTSGITSDANRGDINSSGGVRGRRWDEARRDGSNTRTRTRTETTTTTTTTATAARTRTRNPSGRFGGGGSDGSRRLDVVGVGQPQSQFQEVENDGREDLRRGLGRADIGVKAESARKEEEGGEGKKMNTTATGRREGGGFREGLMMSYPGSSGEVTSVGVVLDDGADSDGDGDDDIDDCEEDGSGGGEGDSGGIRCGKSGSGAGGEGKVRGDGRGRAASAATVARRIEELRREKEAFREVVSRTDRSGV